FVTEESASMVSESVAFRKPVVTLAPKHHDSDESYQKILEKFSTEKRIQRVKISKLESLKIDLKTFNHTEASSVSEIAFKLKQKIEDIL
ncbi:MAG: mitochondrial fission ELM1 family protein, partial [Bacteroidales bacterium]|nr:mitochondrial fission ELM1 family protein [Bacteroidales bacterium]